MSGYDATDIRSLMYQAVGAGSVCWENPGGAGIFDDAKAKEAAERALLQLCEFDLLEGTGDFMDRAGQLQDGPDFPPLPHPSVPSVRHLRRNLLAEEVAEYLKAESEDDLVEVVDGLLDIIVIAWGSLLAYVGEDAAKRAAAEVVRSNLDKVRNGIVRRDDGKVLKPEGWTPPDIAGAIR